MAVCVLSDGFFCTVGWGCFATSWLAMTRCVVLKRTEGRGLCPSKKYYFYVQVIRVGAKWLKDWLGISKVMR